MTGVTRRKLHQDESEGRDDGKAQNSSRAFAQTMDVIVAMFGSAVRVEVHPPNLTRTNALPNSPLREDDAAYATARVLHAARA